MDSAVVPEPRVNLANQVGATPAAANGLAGRRLPFT